MTDTALEPNTKTTAARHGLRARVASNRTWRRFSASKPAVVALVWIVLVFIVALFAEQLAPTDATKQELSRRLEGPSAEHWLGTDPFGRDILSRIIMGTRVAMMAAGQAVGLGLAIGGVLGLVCGWTGRILDALVSRLMDALMSLPFLVVAMAILGVLGPGLSRAMVAVGIVLSPRFYRNVRAATQRVKHEIFIEASRSIGATSRRIVFRHVLPNIASEMMIVVTFALGTAVVAEASLSFLGFGAQPPEASWGLMLSDGFRFLDEAAGVLVVPPAAMIALLILSFSVVGDGLRDALGRGKERT